MLIPVQGVPTFNEEVLFSKTSAGRQKMAEIHLTDNAEKNYQATPTLPLTDRFLKTGTATVNKDVFYIEYRRGLFKWRLGDPEWTNTGLVDTSEQVDEDLRNGFRIATSGETLYVGKRDGRLFQSLDEGSNWRDITSNLPLRFNRFKEIVFLGSTVYVATDKGVLASQTGEYWRVITDTADKRPVINKLTVDGTEVYGTGDTGVYRLSARGRWEQFSTEAPESIVSLAVANGRLYSASAGQGIFYVSLAEQQ